MSDEEMPEDPDHESYFDRRGRQFEEHDEAMKKRAAAPETEDEIREVLNRDDEVLDEPRAWNQTYHEVVIRFRWSDVSGYTEGAMESIETVDGDPIGSAIDAYLQPMYEDDSFEVLSKTHRTEYDD
jgi:hypothetical protein